MNQVLAYAAPSSDTAQPAPPLPSTQAHVIHDSAEAISVAHRFASEIAKGAHTRDRAGKVDLDLLDAFSRTGLWGITVPDAYGGPALKHADVAKVFAILAAADSSIAQIPQNHFEIVEVIGKAGSEEQKKHFFGKILQGYRLGNAFSEFGGKNVEAFETKIVADGKGGFLVSGRKFYSTGALYAHLVPIVALDEEGHVVVAIAQRDAAGLSVINDWSAFGQRTTASGTVILDNVALGAADVLPAHIVYENPSPVGPQSQLIHAAIDAGIAHGAINATIKFVRERARPWIDSGQDRASDDHFTVAAIGHLKIKLHAAEALLERGGHQLDETVAHPTLDTIAAAKIAVAIAKAVTTEVALEATNKLFELSGTRSVLAEHGFDRLWRDARTHTLHDPVRWKYHAVGNYYLNGVHPPLHSWI